VALTEACKTAEPKNGEWQTAAWQIVGAGSIGCLFAAYLQRAGIDVQLVLRDAVSLTLWQQHKAIGLRRGGTEEFIAVPAIAAAQQSTNIQPGALRKLLVCTKAHQTRAAIAALQTAIASDALVILLQNGMGVREQIAELLPDATILHALSTEGAYQTQRFHVVHAGRGETVIGALQSSQQYDRQRLQQVCAQTASALHCELPIVAVDDIGARLWLKLAVNSVINPLTALHECRNGKLLQVPGFDKLLTALCTEVSAVANADGQALRSEQLIDNVRHVCKITADNRSSMLQDRSARRLSEIDFINGYILQRAARHGIACPQQQLLFDELKTLEQKLGCH
jgi:2-dehydropantoate 2-reductase